MNIILYANGTSENHGCEAIMKSTQSMLEGIYDSLYCTTTHLSYEDYLPDKCEWVEYSYYRKPTYFNRAVSKLERILFRHNYYAESKPWLAKVYKAFENCDVAMSVGGDNYCNGSYKWLYLLHDNAIRKGLKTILWGCSVDENCLSDQEMKEDLLKYDVICARESLTYNIISRFHPNVKLYPDPAFTLKTEEIEWKGTNDAEYIGINASPTSIACEKEKGTVIKNYEKLIEYILKETTYHIALIPHVIFQKKYADYAILKKIYDKYSYTKRMLLIEDNNCCALKGYISHCRMFITARTHASIAAYSSCVPTLVLGYSIKAKGIAQDLFGTYENYVLSVQDIVSEDEFVKGFQWLCQNENEIRYRLECIMPSYIQKAYEARNEVI